MERSQVAKVPNGIETLSKISIAWVGWTNVTDDRQTDRQTDGRHIANMNVSSRSLNTNKTQFALCLFLLKTCSFYLVHPRNPVIANCSGLSSPNGSHPSFLANVNSCSCSLYVVVRPSVCLSSVTFVHPTQAIEIFGNVSTPVGTLAICDLSIKIFRRSS